jgi:hypothetical protein
MIFSDVQNQKNQFQIFLIVWSNLIFVIFFQMESDHLGYSSYSSSVVFVDCVGWLPPVNS